MLEHGNQIDNIPSGEKDFGKGHKIDTRRRQSDAFLGSAVLSSSKERDDNLDDIQPVAVDAPINAAVEGEVPPPMSPKVNQLTRNEAVWFVILTRQYSHENVWYKQLVTWTRSLKDKEPCKNKHSELAVDAVDEAGYSVLRKESRHGSGFHAVKITRSVVEDADTITLRSHIQEL